MDTETMITELRSLEEKYKDKEVYTGEVNIASLCHDVSNRLEELNNRVKSLSNENCFLKDMIKFYKGEDGAN